MATDPHTHRDALVRVLAVAAVLGALTAVPSHSRATAAGERLDADELEFVGNAGHVRDSRKPKLTAYFPRESYGPGDSATLVVTDTAPAVSVQLFRAGGEDRPTVPNDVMLGTPVDAPQSIGSVRGRRAIRVHIGDWPSGVYFAQLRSGARTGYAPFVLRPHRLGEHRVAVVLPTQTWQAYNFRDDNGDGVPDTWYSFRPGHLTARLGRAFLDRGVPPHWKQYDAPFVRWLAHTGRNVDYLSDAELRSVASGDRLAHAYDLIVFSGHHEYVTTHEYDVVQRYRDLGGNLMFLAANNFFWKITLHGNVMTRVAQWRDLGRPEAALIGVQYRANDRGGHRGAWILRHAEATPWLFHGLDLADGDGVGSGGIEIDATAPSSPKGVRVLASIPNLYGPGFTAQMTYYETAAGAEVFAAGAFTLAGSVWEPQIATLMTNLWTHLSTPEGNAARADREDAPSPGRPGIAAYFTQRSYAPGTAARLVVSGPARPLGLQILRAGGEASDPQRDDVLNGVAVTRPTRVAGTSTVAIGDWPSGLYFARLTDPASGLLGYAVFVVRPSRLGEHRVAVVLPTNTWQAYNFRDGETWYADSHITSVGLERPFLDRGVPPHFRGYDRGFLRWLAHTGKTPDFLADDDLEHTSGAALARAYDLIVFSGHEEYVTTHEYDAVERYRDLGGNLAFLSANNFFYRVEHRGDRLYRTGRWRDLGRPEAALVGIQYLDWNHDEFGNAPYVVSGVERAPWFFRGTSLRNGDRFGVYGIEIDARTGDSPRGVQVLATIPNIFGRGRSAEMTYYTTPRGAKVFAAGSINFGGSALFPPVSRLLENLWTTLSRP